MGNLNFKSQTDEAIRLLYITIYTFPNFFIIHNMSIVLNTFIFII